jgi:hypothetical protein
MKISWFPDNRILPAVEPPSPVVLSPTPLINPVLVIAPEAIVPSVALPLVSMDATDVLLAERLISTAFDVVFPALTSNVVEADGEPPDPLPLTMKFV